jgi:hypothetical protein
MRHVLQLWHSVEICNARSPMCFSTRYVATIPRANGESAYCQPLQAGRVHYDASYPGPE